ncbi:hypothetical protein L7F22_005869 [Adiantum nelumboides]|nr:hypothetical protein [Adiantum nelumboides]
MDPRKIGELKTFIQLCDSNPSLLQDPSLRFFRNYLEKLEAKLPPSAYGKSEASKASKAEESDDDMPELEEQSGGFKPRAAAFADDSSGTEEESEVELDNSDVVEPDNDPPQKIVLMEGKKNVVVDVLSRKPQVFAVSISYHNELEEMKGQHAEDEDFARSMNN